MSRIWIWRHIFFLPILTICQIRLKPSSKILFPHVSQWAQQACGHTPGKASTNEHHRQYAEENRDAPTHQRMRRPGQYFLHFLAARFNLIFTFLFHCIYLSNTETRRHRGERFSVCLHSASIYPPKKKIYFMSDLIYTASAHEYILHTRFNIICANLSHLCHLRSPAPWGTSCSGCRAGFSSSDLSRTSLSRFMLLHE